MARYIITCTNGFGRDQGLITRGIGRVEVSEHVWVVSTERNAAWLLEVVKKGVADPGGVFVARLDPHEDIECQGCNEEAERRYGQDPGRRVLRNLTQSE